MPGIWIWQRMWLFFGRSGSEGCWLGGGKVEAALSLRLGWKNASGFVGPKVGFWMFTQGRRCKASADRWALSRNHVVVDQSGCAMEWRMFGAEICGSNYVAIFFALSRAFKSQAPTIPIRTTSKYAQMKPATVRVDRINSKSSLKCSP